MTRLVVAAQLILVFAPCASAQDVLRPYLTTTEPLTLLSANDGEIRYLHTATGAEQQIVDDSFTVIHLGPDRPPMIEIVEGTVPVTIHGSPHIAISEDGRYGFISNHGWRGPAIVKGNEQVVPPEHLKNVLSVIDLKDLSVVDQVELPGVAWMVDLHPDGKKAIVSVGAGFHIYGLQEGKLQLIAKAKAPSTVFSFDVSPQKDRIIAVTVKAEEQITDDELHLFALKGDMITHLHRIEAKEGMGPIEEAFSPRISPDGKTAIVLHDNGIGGQGSRDDILIVDLSLKRPAVTQRIRQVGDGLESLAFHPSGTFAVICCLDKGPDVATTSHLATIDLTTRPARLSNHIPIEPVPEGIEFTSDGSMLFVQATLANHIVVYDVDGMTLRRSPFVLCTGHAPSSMAISRRCAD